MLLTLNKKPKLLSCGNFFSQNAANFCVMYQMQNLSLCKKHGSYTCRATSALTETLRNFVGNIPTLLNFVRRIPTHDIMCRNNSYKYRNNSYICRNNSYICKNNS